MNLKKFISRTGNMLVVDSFVKADSIINSDKYQNIACSISGGSDSDIMLDLCRKVDRKKKITYVWFDTGMEYEATKEHLLYLESRYRIRIDREKAAIPIPACCRSYGQPFLSKYVSDQIRRLQASGFRWEDQPYDDLRKKYPDCSSALRWWCDEYGYYNGAPSRFSIARNKLLKQFLIEYPPWFQISAKCCYYAKKKVSDRLIKERGIDLLITGVRKYEGGIRSVAYPGCFSADTSKRIAEYRPLFWYSKETKRDYDARFQIRHSRCYTQYGMRRTGCAGCPYNRDIISELHIIRCYEPRLERAAASVFCDSYEYTQMYREYVIKKEAF